jgi:hypothetical protein
VIGFSRRPSIADDGSELTIAFLRPAVGLGTPSTPLLNEVNRPFANFAGFTKF